MKTLNYGYDNDDDNDDDDGYDNHSNFYYNRPNRVTHY